MLNITHYFNASPPGGKGVIPKDEPVTCADEKPKTKRKRKVKTTFKEKEKNGNNLLNGEENTYEDCSVPVKKKCIVTDENSPVENQQSDVIEGNDNDEDSDVFLNKNSVKKRKRKTSGMDNKLKKKRRKNREKCEKELLNSSTHKLSNKESLIQELVEMELKSLKNKKVKRVKYKAKTQKSNNVSENDEIVSTNCVTKQIKNKNETVTNNESEQNVCIEGNNLQVDCIGEGVENCENGNDDSKSPTLTKSEQSEKRNSLFNYYTKVDKAEYQATKVNEKIQVKAVIHTPPNKKLSSSDTSSSESCKIFKSKKCKMQIPKDYDEITLISSEIITDSEETNIVDELNVPFTEADPNDTHNWKMRLSFSSSKLPDHSNGVDDNSQESIDEFEGEKRTVDSTLEKKKIKKTRRNLNKLMRSKKNKRKPKDDPCDNEDSDDSVKITNWPKEKSSNIVSKIVHNKNSTSVGIMAKFLGRNPIEKVKPMIDPTVLEARQKFLKSGVPDALKQKTENTQSNTTLASPAPFPEVSHVQQRNHCSAIWKSSPTSIKLEAAPLTRFKTLFPKWIPLNSDSTMTCAKELLSFIPLKPVVDVKRRLKKLSKQFPNYNVGETWNAINVMKSESSGFDVWVDVYKPRNSTDFISNGDNIEQLKTWMESLKRNPRNKQDSDSSGAEFVSSDSEEKSITHSTCIVSGSYGCGKTSAVYAVANELGYKVFEINASSNRSGKKILTDLSEATQSHQVEHSKTNFFQLGKFKKKKNELSSEYSSSKKRSLILVEDADLLFADKDDGFVAAVQTLADSSKRPLVLVVNDANALHLIKFQAMNLLKLKFSLPSPARLGVWLQLIALSEGIRLNCQAAERLVNWSECDIRKSLLQLQVLVGSHKENEKSWPGICDSPRWVSPVSSECSSEDQQNVDKEELRKKLNFVHKRAQSLVVHDLLTHSAFLLSKQRDPCPVPCKVLSLDSTSLTDDLQHSNGKELSDNIADYLYGSVTTCFTTEWRNHKETQKTNSVLKSVLPLYNHCAHSAVYTDFLPALRTIGRIDSNKLALHTKRTNRFFSYLNGLGCHANETSLKSICEVFS